MTEPLQIAYSPCPNDTFVFDALAHGRVPGGPALDVTFADIDITNGMAERGESDVLKVSFPHADNVHEPDAFAAWDSTQSRPGYRHSRESETKADGMTRPAVRASRDGLAAARPAAILRQS